jgi:hypothetical protein
MEPLVSWPPLASLCELAKTMPGLQLWLFGSALRSRSPRDLDVLIVYSFREDVATIRDARRWSDEQPPIEIIAMTIDEEQDYSFISGVGARRLV